MGQGVVKVRSVRGVHPSSRREPMYAQGWGGAGGACDVGHGGAGAETAKPVALGLARESTRAGQ